MTALGCILIVVTAMAWTSYVWHLGYEAGHEHGREYEAAAREIGRYR